MDKATAQALAEDIRNALAPVASRYGLTVELSGGKYYADGAYEPKIRLVSDDFAQAEWNRHAPLHDLPRDMVGETVELDGHTFTIRGFLPKNRSYPVAATNEFGEPRKMRVTPALVAALAAIKGKVE